MDIFQRFLEGLHNNFDPVALATELEVASAGDLNFKDDVTKMIIYYLQWGTISEAEKETVRMLQSKYSIQDGVGGLFSFDVNLERVSAAFPGETCRILQEESIERAVTSIELDVLGLEIPFCMRTRSFFSLIPCTASDKIFRLKLVKACLAYQYLEIKFTKAAKNAKEIMSEILVRLSFTYNLKFLNSSQRSDYMKLLNIKEADTASGVFYFERLLKAPVDDSVLNMHFGTLC